MKKSSVGGSPRPLRRDDRPSSAGAVERVRSKEKRRSRTPPIVEGRHQTHFGSEAENSLPGDVILPNQDIFINDIPFNPPHPLDIKLMSGGPPGLEGDLVFPAKHVGGSHKSNGHYNSVESLTERLEVQTRELDEAKARAAQMEKTMRWWSDCTANWREKWGKVRAERNKSREEVRQLRIKLEAAVKECLILKRGKQECSSENDVLRKQVTELQKAVLEYESRTSEVNVRPAKPKRDQSVNNNNTSSDSTNNENRTKLCHANEKIQASSSGNSSASSTVVFDNLGENIPEEKEEDGKQNDAKLSSPKKKNKTLVPSPEEEKLEQKAFMLQMKLEEAGKTLQIERTEKDALHEEIGRLQQDLVNTKNQYEELVEAKEQLMKELSLMRTAHQQEVGRLTSDLEDETNVRYSMDRRIADLRKELERMQSENAAEWGKRERLETEKLSLERELKKYRSQVHDLQESMSRKNRQITSDTEQKMKTMDDDINLKSKELVDLKHSFTKTKKLLQEKQDELDHTRKVAENNEAEVKKLRVRVDELKKNLAKAEDDFDQQGNQLRKVERNLEDSRQQTATLVTQVEHLQTRLRAQTSVANATPNKKRNTYNQKGRFDDDCHSNQD